MKTLKHILIGWGKKYGFLPTSAAEEALSTLRLKQCVECPFHRIGKALELLNGDAVYTDVIYCTRCTCPASQKSLVVSETCPEGRW